MARCQLSGVWCLGKQVSDVMLGFLTPDTWHPTPLSYQLELRTPGIKPWSANLRKQIRQMPNLRYTARGRPHSWQRFSRRVLNFGTLFALAILDLLATEFPFELLAISC